MYRIKHLLEPNGSMKNIDERPMVPMSPSCCLWFRWANQPIPYDTLLNTLMGRHAMSLCLPACSYGVGQDRMTNL